MSPIHHPLLKGAALVCFSHLRWDFVYQRPQHLLSRLARGLRVLYIEEPVPAEGEPRMALRNAAPGVEVAVPHLPRDECAPGHPAGEGRQRLMLDALLAAKGIEQPVLWYYTPMSLGVSAHLPAGLVVYDCMDELSNFQGAPSALVPRERALLAAADLVFTGGYSLYEAKRRAHHRVHLFPSSVDRCHFAKARRPQQEPPDMVDLPHPRIGFHGVLDERLDIELLAAVAQARPQWQWVLVGPVVKIDPDRLPRLPNIHYLGSKRYEDLPRYLGSWDVAMMPFAINAATRFISPTKTPEYLAGGCPVVSTPIVDVVNDYGRSGLVSIAQGADEFVQAVQSALDGPPARSAALCQRADALLQGMSWDRTCEEMAMHMARHLSARTLPSRWGPRSTGTSVTPPLEIKAWTTA